MIAKISAGLTAACLLSAPAIAGPYANVESNSGYSGSDYSGTTTDIHVGYEGPVGEGGSYYVQGGPAIVSVDGEDSTTELSGKAGIGFNVTESLNLYGEVSFITVDGDDDNNYGTKVGLKYSF
jgi:outer membrane autotransporter protein